MSSSSKKSDRATSKAQRRTQASAQGGYYPASRGEVLEEQAAAADRRIARLPALLGSVIRLAWRASPRRLLVVLGLSVGTASGLAAAVFVTSSVVADVFAAAGGQTSVAGAAGSLLLLVAMTSLVRLATVASSLQSGLLAQRVQVEVEAELLDAVARVPLERFEQAAFHDRVWRAVVNAVNAPTQALTAAMTLVAGLLSVATLGALMTSFQWVLLPVLLLSCAVEMWFAGRSAKATYNASVELVGTSQVREVLRRILFRRETAAEARAFGLREPVMARYREATNVALQVGAGVMTANAKRTLLSAMGTGTASTLGWGVLLFLFVSDDLTLPAAIASGYAFQQARARLVGVTGAVSSLYGASLFLSGFQELRGEGAESQHTAADQPVDPFQTLSVEHVSFTYPGGDTRALRDVSVTIERGDVIALVGENGSGKTTLAKLLGQLYQPTEGSILWDGVGTDGLDPEQLRRHIAVIFQDFVRYELSAQHNIGFGDASHADDLERISHAAHEAGIGTYLEALPDAYSTVLTPRLGGVDLSGGQWQRIALARAYFRNAALIILDEPTSALDARAEKDLFDRLRQLAAGRTVVLISHRFSTVRSADQIIVLDKGSVVERGTHAELIKAGKHYAEMYNLQASAFLDTEPGLPPTSEADTPVEASAGRA